jgi:hypothetical protein
MIMQAIISGIIGIIPKLITMWMAYSQGKTVKELEQVKLQNKALKEWAKHSAEEIHPEEAYKWFVKKTQKEGEK